MFIELVGGAIKYFIFLDVDAYILYSTSIVLLVTTVTAYLAIKEWYVLCILDIDFDWFSWMKGKENNVMKHNFFS